MNNIKLILYLIVLSFFHTQQAQADISDKKLPLWELGIAGGILNIPHYEGSEQKYTLPLAFPYLIYRGDFLKADEEGIRGELFNSESVSIDLGFSFGLPVKGDNRAREGMPDLHLSGQIGPRLNWFITKPKNGPQISFHLPVRHARDIKNTSQGWVVEPSIKIEQRNIGPGSRFSARFDAGLLYANKRYHDYYYEVAPQFATASRTEYEASSGLSNFFLGVSGSYKLSERLNLNGFVRWKTLSPGVVDDSPLVTDENYFALGIGVNWIFKTSE